MICKILLQQHTCCWEASLTLAKWKNFGSALFEPLCPCEAKMSIKKVFHFWPSEIAASVHGRYGLSRLDWPHMLAATSEGQIKKTFCCSVCRHMGIEVQKIAIPTLFYFARVRAAAQPLTERGNTICISSNASGTQKLIAPHLKNLVNMTNIFSLTLVFHSGIICRAFIRTSGYLEDSQEKFEIYN